MALFLSMAQGERMEIIQLEAFVKAAETGSFTAAAGVLNLSQPSVSARIAGLEASLNGKLFERGGRQLKLTAMGRMFLPYAENILTTATSAQEVMARYAAGKTGMVRVASLDMPAVYMLREPISQFRRTYPDVDFSLTLRTTPQIVDGVHSGQAHLGLIGTRLWSKRIQVLARFIEPIQAFVAPQHQLAALQAKQDSITVSDLYQHTIYRATLNAPETAIVDAIVENARYGSGGAVIYLPMIMTVGMMLSAKGVAFLPESAVKHHLKNERLIALEIEDLNPMQNELLLVALVGHEFDVPTADFVQMICREWQHIRVD
ncbi:MAG: LysR family transcriptional regulator [Aggregatilineales bacterium]